MSIELVMPSNHLILCHPLLLPSIFLSIRIFSSESVLHIKWPKYWSFSFNISPSNEYSGLISFRIDWLDLFAVQKTLKSLLQHHSSKASILWCSAFFIVQLSHLYMTTGKNIALIRWTFVGKVMSLLFNMLPRPGMLWFMGSQRVGHNSATELNWTEFGHSFTSKEQESFYFMAAITICSDFGAQENKGHKQNLVHTRTQEKGAVTPQETDPDFPVSVQESPVEAWVSGGLLQGRGTECVHGNFLKR